MHQNSYWRNTTNYIAGIECRNSGFGFACVAVFAVSETSR